MILYTIMDTNCNETQPQCRSSLQKGQYHVQGQTCCRSLNSMTQIDTLACTEYVKDFLTTFCFIEHTSLSSAELEITVDESRVFYLTFLHVKNLPADPLV